MTKTKTFNAEDFKCRCSAIHAVMANSRSNPQLTDNQAKRLSELEDKVMLTPKMQEEMAELLVKKENGKKIILSDTCIEHLMEWYAWETRKKVKLDRQVMNIPQMQKGICVEPESIKLLCAVDKKLYIENRDSDGKRERIYNEYLTGEVDAYVGESIIGAEIITDAKSIFDYPTFLCKIKQPLTTANELQLQGYGDLTGSKNLFVANCLVNTPEHIIYSYRRKLLESLLNSMQIVTEESPLFIEKWEILEESMRFDDIPPNERVFKKVVEPMTETQRQLIYTRVEICREWLHKFHQEYKKMNTNQ